MMFRTRYIIIILLFAAYVILEAVYFVGKRIAPDYHGVYASDASEVVSVSKGRLTYHFYPVDVTHPGTLFVNFIGELKGKTDKQPKMTFTLVNESEKENLLKSDTAISHFNKVVLNGEKIDLSIYQRRRFFLLRQFVPEGGRHYLIVGHVITTSLKGEKVYYFVTSFRDKLKCFWPYFVIILRNFVIACIVLFFACCLYKIFRKPGRFITVLLSCGLLAFIISATPFNVFYSAVEGPKARNILWEDINKELKQDSAVCKIPVAECFPYSACFIRIKGRALDSSDHALIYTDFYKAPSYDDASTENLLTFFKDKSSEFLYVFDTAHSFYKDFSLRFWHEGRGGAAVVENVRLTEVKLPSGFLKILLSVAETSKQCFLVLWFAFFVSFYFLKVFLQRNVYCKLAAFILAFVALAILTAPIYSFGYKEPMMSTTDDRLLLGLKPFSFYSLVWHNEPKPDLTPEQLEAPIPDSLQVASFSDHVLGSRTDIYPDDTDTFLRFFTRNFSNIRVNMRRELVSLKGLRLVRLNSAFLALRMVAWLWLIVLILDSLFQALKMIVKGANS